MSLARSDNLPPKGNCAFASPYATVPNPPVKPNFRLASAAARTAAHRKHPFDWRNMMMKRSAFVVGTTRDCTASASSNEQQSALQRAATIQGVPDLIPRATRILRLPQVQDLVGLRRSTIYNRMQNGEFPRPIKLGRTSGWVQAEIEAWLSTQIEESRRIQP